MKQTRKESEIIKEYWNSLSRHKQGIKQLSCVKEFFLYGFTNLIVFNWKIVI